MGDLKIGIQFLWKKLLLFGGNQVGDDTISISFCYLVAALSKKKTKTVLADSRKTGHGKGLNWTWQRVTTIE